MRVVLIAGFSNGEIRRYLTIKRYGFFVKWLIKIFKLPDRLSKLNDYGNWIKTIIDDFEKRDDLELFVIAPHLKLKHKMEQFEIRGIHYFFYSSEFSHFIRMIKNKFLWQKLQNSSSCVKKIVSRIKPDLIILSGAENPVTAVSILSLGEYPRLCLCQTVYNDPELRNYFKPDRIRQQIELDIFKDVKYFGVYCKKHFDLLNLNSHGRYIFRFNYPDSIELPEPVPMRKEFDFINFAQVHSPAKGSPDSVLALAIVKRKFPDVKLNLVGGIGEAMRTELNRIIKEYGLENNVVFTPFFENKEDLLIHIQKSRFAVLPCKLDNTSGTMSQCMNRGIPIVVYKTTGTPLFNRIKQCALIAEMNDIDGLASHMISLMSDPDLANTLSMNGRWFKENQAQSHIDNWNQMVDCFPLIVDHFKNGTPIPNNRLYDPNIADV